MTHFDYLRSHFSMTVKIFQVTVIEASQSCLFCYEEHTLKEIIGSDDEYILNISTVLVNICRYLSV